MTDGPNSKTSMMEEEPIAAALWMVAVTTAGVINGVVVWMVQ